MVVSMRSSIEKNAFEFQLAVAGARKAVLLLMTLSNFSSVLRRLRNLTPSVYLNASPDEKFQGEGTTMLVLCVLA